MKAHLPTIAFKKVYSTENKTNSYYLWVFALTPLITSVYRVTGTALGSVLTGVVIDVYSPLAGFILSSAFSLLLILSVIYVKGVRTKENIVGPSGMFNDLAEGFTLLRNNRILRNLALLAGVSLPIGQLSNAILSSFIHDDLGEIALFLAL